jgi:hypothetical protein
MTWISEWLESQDHNFRLVLEQPWGIHMKLEFYPEISMNGRRWHLDWIKIHVRWFGMTCWTTDIHAGACTRSRWSKRSYPQCHSNVIKPYRTVLPCQGDTTIKLWASVYPDLRNCNFCRNTMCKSCLSAGLVRMGVDSSVLVNPPPFGAMTSTSITPKFILLNCSLTVVFLVVMLKVARMVLLGARRLRMPWGTSRRFIALLSLRCDHV